MKCPLFAAAFIMSDRLTPEKALNCLKEECAWWVKVSQSCAMEAIPRIIGYVGSELKTIKEKMPHEE